MARLIMCTFAFLGWSFYEMSGGSEFEPETLEDVMAVAEVEASPLDAVEVEEEKAAVVVAQAVQTPAIDPVLPAPTIREADATNTITLASLTPAVTAPTIEFNPAAGGSVRSAAPTAPVLEQAETTVKEPAADLRLVSGNRVNVRNGPGTSYQVLTQVVRGDETEVLQSVDGWAKIRISTNGRIGWMSEDFLKAVN